MSLATAASAARQYVTLGIDREVFAVDVNQVHEILDVRPIARVPNAPVYMLGMIDVRSRTVPVVDLRVRLGFAPAEPTHHTRIVVLDVVVGGRELAMGLMADRVYEVTDLAEHSLEPPPEIGTRWNSAYIQGVGRHQGAFVIVLDLAHLFSSEDGAQLAGVLP